MIITYSQQTLIRIFITIMLTKQIFHGYNNQTKNCIYEFDLERVLIYYNVIWIFVQLIAIWSKYNICLPISFAGLPGKVKSLCMNSNFSRDVWSTQMEASQPFDQIYSSLIHNKHMCMHGRVFKNY